MSEQIYGIEKSKEFVTDVLIVVNEAVEAGKDGIQLMDALTLAAQAPRINNAIKAFPQVKKELGELSPEERSEFLNHFKVKFNITNKKLEAFIEHVIDYGSRAIDFVAEGIGIVAELKALKEPEAPAA